LAKAGGFERIRVEAEKKAGARQDGPFSRAVHDSFPWKWMDTQRFAADRGTPTIWRVTNDLNGPRLQLVSSQIEQRQRAIALSVLIGLLCLVAWLVTYTPRLVTLLQALWPEQIALLGYLGWQTLGPHVGFVVLFLFAAAGRIFCLARWISGLAGRPAAPSVATDDNLSPTA